MSHSHTRTRTLVSSPICIDCSGKLSMYCLLPATVWAIGYPNTVRNTPSKCSDTFAKKNNDWKKEYIKCLLTCTNYLALGVAASGSPPPPPTLAPPPNSIQMLQCESANGRTCAWLIRKSEFRKRRWLWEIWPRTHNYQLWRCIYSPTYPNIYIHHEKEFRCMGRFR